MSQAEGDYSHSILLIPAKNDPERDTVAALWPGEVVRLDRFWEPPELDRGRVRLYGPDTFCLVVAQKLELELISPSDDLLLQAPRALLQREIRLLTLVSLRHEVFPLFVKSLVPKLFRSRVYGSWKELEGECQGLEDSTQVIISQVVDIRAEARAFVLCGRVRSCAVYEGEAEAPKYFLQQATDELQLPVTCVLDAALLKDGWALLEANASWGAGLNGCDPAAILPCLEAATQAG